MSKINVLFTFVTFALFLFPACSEDDVNSPDGDSDTSITDGDGETDRDGNAQTDGDNTVTVHTCDEASPYAFTTDTAVFEGWQDDCRNFEAVYDDPELTEYHQLMGYSCSPVRLKLEGIGETVFCEVAAMAQPPANPTPGLVQVTAAPGDRRAATYVPAGRRMWASTMRFALPPGPNWRLKSCLNVIIRKRVVKI